MPSYFYHLKFELYPTSNPTAAASSHAHLPRAQAQPFWIPPREADIFRDQLPTHSSTRSPPPRHPKPPSPPPIARAPGPASAAASSVIDCGQSSRDKWDDSAAIGPLRRLRRPTGTHSLPPPAPTAAINPQTAVHDWRFGPLSIESINLREDSGGDASDVDAAGMSAHASCGQNAQANASEGIGPRLAGPGTSTRAQFSPLGSNKTNIGWGIVHFYREGDETPALGGMPATDSSEPDEDGCTTLCIPAVPSYFSPADFLGFVGEKWKADISHYRMIMTPRMNRYLVLMKARDAQRAKLWRKEFDGKIFNSMESQICHVVFIKTVTFETPTVRPPNSPTAAQSASPVLSRATAISSLKPFPPPTPDLIELPTCPVCLERMDDTTGLMTIPCQHVFHCSCLQSWTGSGCPVCRHTAPDQYDPRNPFTQPFGSHVSNLCSVCDSADELWICLICGNVGCGRYKGGHAKDHWKETAHCFALELETQHVWDYAGDTWVHRLIREKGGGKILELPASTRPPDAGGPGQEQDVVPRAKLDSIGLEYTHLISSQLESQRNYFEEMVSKAADKAAKAMADAERAALEAESATRRAGELEEKLRSLGTDTVPQLERDLDRERNKAAKAQDLARSLGKSLQEEKGVGEGLMKRVEHISRESEDLKKRIAELETQKAELEEMNRDLGMFISGGEKLKQMQAEGQIEKGELEGGSVGVAERRRRRKK